MPARSRASLPRRGTGRRARPSHACAAGVASRSLQIAHQRQDRLLKRIGGERADLLVANDSRLVDDERLGNAVDAEIDADTSVEIDDRQLVRVAVGGEPGEPVLALVLV